MPRSKLQSTDTKFMIDLKDKLININHLAEGTANLYITKLKKLNNNQPFTTFSFLKDTKGITSMFNTYENDNTRKSYISAVVAVLNYSDMKQYKSINQYYKSLLADTKKMFDEKPENEMSEKQSENWIEWKEVRKIWTDLGDSVKHFNADILKSSAHSKRLYQDYILLSLFVTSPPRRNADYWLMKIDADNKTNEAFNYYRPFKNKFIFNKFKTSKTYGTEMIDVNKTLSGILNKYIKDMELKDDDYLLNPSDTERKSSSVITKNLNRIFKKNISSSLLRHIFITDQLGDTIKKLKDVSDGMGHSSEMQAKYVLHKKEEEAIEE